MHLSTTSTFHRQRNRLAASAAALLAASGMTLALATPSHAAGTYGVQSCDGGSPSLGDAYGGWTSFSSANVPGMDTTNSCYGGTISASINTGPNGRIAPLGGNVGWRFTAPSGTYLSSASMVLSGWVRAYQTPDAAQRDQGLVGVYNGATQKALYSSSSITALTNGTNLSLGSLSGSTLDIEVICDGPTGDDGCYYETGRMTARYPRIMLGDDNAPNVTRFSGAASTDLKYKGTESLDYVASDTGGGVTSFRFYVDGQMTDEHIIDTAFGHCQPLSGNTTWYFGFPRPCPSSVDTTEAINSTVIADGQHTITAKITDAGQREATIFNRSNIVVANHPPTNTVAPRYTLLNIARNPIVGTELPSDEGTWTGPSLTKVYGWQRCDNSGGNCAQIPGATALIYTPTGADVGHTLRLAVTATNAADSVTAFTDPTGVVTAPSSSTDTTVKPTDPPPTTTTPPATTPPATQPPSAGGQGGGAAGVVPVPAPTLTTNVTNNERHLLIGRVAGEAPGIACPADKATLKLQHIKGGQVTLRYGTAATAQLELTCTASGKAITAAKLEIATKTGSQPTVAADVTTDGAGHAVLRLARGASRGVTVGYRMYADDPIARATTTLKVLVAGRVSLKANKKSLRNGHPVTLTGSLAGGLVPKRGVTLAVQWKDGKRWRPFAQIKTNTKGAFKYAYKFTRTNKKISYTLRVQVLKGQIDYPYLASVSKTVRVTVAP